MEVSKQRLVLLGEVIVGNGIRMGGMGGVGGIGGVGGMGLGLGLGGGVSLG